MSQNGRTDVTDRERESDEKNVIRDDIFDLKNWSKNSDTEAEIVKVLCKMSVYISPLRLHSPIHPRRFAASQKGGAILAIILAFFQQLSDVKTR